MILAGPLAGQARPGAPVVEAFGFGEGALPQLVGVAGWPPVPPRHSARAESPGSRAEAAGCNTSSPGSSWGSTGSALATERRRECGWGAGAASGPGDSDDRLWVATSASVAGSPASDPMSGLSPARWLEASYRRIEPATAALSELTRPRIGIRTTESQRRRTAGPRPCPSLPTTTVTGPRRSAWRAVSDASASEPIIRKPRTWRSVRASARSSTGTSSRCSTAPADALIAAAERGAWWRTG